MEICFTCRKDEGFSGPASAIGVKLYADFMCKELMLEIEIDGITRQWEEVIKNDEIGQRPWKRVALLYYVLLMMKFRRIFIRCIVVWKIGLKKKIGFQG